jgi:hypothetical protein
MKLKASAQEDAVEAVVEYQAVHRHFELICRSRELKVIVERSTFPGDEVRAFFQGVRRPRRPCFAKSEKVGSCFR